MWVFGVGKNLNSTVAFLDSKFSNSQTHKELTKVTFINLEEGELIITESELEIETDLEWFGFENSVCNFSVTSEERKNQLQGFSYFSSKKSVPLYDLYCNWKFHLS